MLSITDSTRQTSPAASFTEVTLPNARRASRSASPRDRPRAISASVFSAMCDWISSDRSSRRRPPNQRNGFKFIVLLRPQGHHRVYTTGASRREPTRGERDDTKQHRNRSERRRVVHAHL